MYLYHSFDELPKLDTSIVTLGNFDGVHLGHQLLIRNAVNESRKADVKSVLVTFDPHPIEVLKPEIPFKRISTSKEVACYVHILGIDVILQIPFTQRFSIIKPFDFLNKYIKKYLNPMTIYVGFDHRFGRDRGGDLDTLKQFGYENHVTIQVVPPCQISGKTISSTVIKEYIQTGDLENAQQMLGRYFQISGIVQPGEKRGEELGFPTANLVMTDRILPPPGIYASRTACETMTCNSITYIGSSPTFGGKEHRIETHLLGFQGNLYQKTITVEFIKFIRRDKRFRNKQDLIRQMEEDCRVARSVHSLVFNKTTHSDHQENS